MTAHCRLQFCHMRSSSCDTIVRLGVRVVLCWSAFPLVSAFGSADSAADRSALFAGFKATMTGSDVPRSCIIGFGSSPSRCGPATSTGRTRELPGSDAIPSCVMGSSTTAERQRLASRRRTCCPRRCLPPRPLRDFVIRGSMAHPQDRCVRFALTVADDYATLTTGRPLPLTRTGLPPVGSRQLLLAHKQSISLT
jgi:hypothetical protein